ncbi:Retinoblastoma-like protein 2 [Liparis tanakae]|uniref:Retinoblastoma-like protein 2 n=1 Tax=Liparis tanakae TaxID=230148 RepID=A0A4Z2FM75_9TELE|nr:Retinoblastoma-like protein 2 [Liparis tanakae]
MKKWQDMADLPQDFRRSTNQLERNFTVSAVIFKKYVPIFKAIFKAPWEEPARVHRSRKQRRHPCSVTEVFNFCWVLFVHAKGDSHQHPTRDPCGGNFPLISDDLVNSYHLLLCALDLVFSNALLCNARRDLLNADFRELHCVEDLLLRPAELHPPESLSSSGRVRVRVLVTLTQLNLKEVLLYQPCNSYSEPCLRDWCRTSECSSAEGVPCLPEDFSTKDFRPSSGPYCFMQKLCELHGGLLLEAKGVKEHFWKPFIKRLFHKRVYEEHILATGSLDERIFTGEGASEDIGAPGPSLCEGVQRQDSAPCRLHTGLTASALKESLPLSVGASPVSSNTTSVGRLHTLLWGAGQGPGATLAETLRTCARDPSDVISKRLKDMFELLCQHYEGSGAESGSMGRDMAVKYFHLAEALYYRVLEAIIEREKRILGDADLSCILEQDVFHRSLLACCLEVVVFSYRPPGDFPNLISIFQLPAYHFYKVSMRCIYEVYPLYKVIEVLVRSEQGLFREVVKHLNQVEEQVLESLAWTSESPLWESLHGAKDHAPACKQVMPLQYLEQSDQSSSVPLTPINQGPELRGVSLTPTTLLDRYSSPPTGPFRRRLFVDPVDGEPHTGGTKTAPSCLVAAIPAGQTVVSMATATVTANNGQTVTIPVQGIANESGGITFFPVQVNVSGPGGATLPALTGTLQPAAPKPARPAAVSPLRKGSLSLFFRKVYSLAGVRLRDLCSRLDVSSELRRKIWTCFEHSLVHCSELMKDRHLDQLLLCAVYVMAKVTKEDKSFQNIMKAYRTQPQASSTVYRSVLISGRSRRPPGGSQTPETSEWFYCSSVLVF